MQFNEFLQLVKVIRMLYGTEIAADVFAKNISKYYNLNYHEFVKSEKD